MAYRPVFYGDAFGYKKHMIDFEFFTGFSLSQKQKSIQSLHKSISRNFPGRKILEVSSKSPDEIGRQASAFNLNVILKSGKEFSVEQIFQGSKKFRRGGSQLHLIDQMTSKELKKYIGKLHQVDELVSFECFGQIFPLKPQTFFYNWLYINSLHKNQLLANQIINYDTFTDIEFNPNKSKNCQAEACSIYVYLYKSNLLDFALSSKENFLQVVYQEKKGDSYFSTKQNNFKKISLFDYEEEAKQSKVIHSKKIPKYRNISFDNEWENKSLGSTVEIIMGQSPDSKNYTDNPNDYILVQGNADMQNGRVVPRVWTTQITKLAEKGDLILSVRAPVGDIGKTDYNVVLGRGVAAIKGNEFIFQLLSRMKQTNYWAKFSTGSTFESINSSDIKSAEIYLPSQDEQSAIGSLFRTLDDLLTSYKDNLANYQTLKTTMLSKMFPKDGQTVPEIRLKGFEGEWKEKEFSKLVKRVTQSSDSDSLPKVEFEDIVSGQGQLNKDISRKFDNRKGIHFKPGYTLYGKLRPYLNNWLLPKFEGVALGDFWVFDPNGNDSNFIYYLVQSNRYQKVANDTSGTKMPRSDWKSVSTTVFAIPQTIAEQQAIGAYFSNLDNLIATHQEKISQLETLKKKLLQDMFI
nr:restriction endonuclease subunit S [Streptococcus oralis]